jgi:uncharacterized protein YdhG (YjbR/CyaY superfamily)
MQSKAKTPQEYIDSLPEERKAIIQALRTSILKNLPPGFSEEMSYGMLGYVVPHSLYPKGYHANPRLPLPFLNVASQKNHIAVYHMALYKGGLLDWFKSEWPLYSSKKLDMGKGCIRFKKPEDVPVELIGKLASKLTPGNWVELYENAFLKR